MRLASRGGTPACELWRVPCESGLLLSAVGSPSPGVPPLEYVVQALALTRLAGGIAHEVKNPLNAMALQLALLSDKIGAASEELSHACASNLASLKNQVVRIDEVVRRFLDVADPSPAASFDLASLLEDASTLFGHEARRRHVTVIREPPTGTPRALGDPARATRLVLGLLSSVLSNTPDGGRLATRVGCASGEVYLHLEHTRGPEESSLAFVPEVLRATAADLKGRLERTEDQDTIRVALRLPKERPL
ncbi:MAG TPA: histidine kinase dimerization/phospho-acceptor domain-containing protein [Anaeromyxobacteraceae bacterium]|nr:histidine kinase dimerization/phospho-acceptor domain-containing protein [Anaeromyxobacteraceae bacterium]